MRQYRGAWVLVTGGQIHHFLHERGRLHIGVTRQDVIFSDQGVTITFDNTNLQTVSELLALDQVSSEESALAAQELIDMQWSTELPIARDAAHYLATIEAVEESYLL